MWFADGRRRGNCGSSADRQGQRQRNSICFQRPWTLLELVVAESELRGMAGADLIVRANVEDFSTMDYNGSTRSSRSATMRRLPRNKFSNPMN